MKDEKAHSDLRLRTRRFATRVMRLGDSLPHSRSANVVAYQLIKAGSSVGAHYREAQRCRSNAEFVSKLEGALMELEEAAYWMEIVTDLEMVAATKMSALRQEADELTAMLTAAVRKLKRRAKPTRSVTKKSEGN